MIDPVSKTLACFGAIRNVIPIMTALLIGCVLVAQGVAAEPFTFVTLNHGAISADVEPQPKNLPMIVRTPAAEIEVVGTQFNVDSEPAILTEASTFRIQKDV